MDQNKTNDPEKRNWREKLGIGTNGAAKELPKISDDFKKAAPASPSTGAPMATAPRAPIAPRVEATAKPAVKPAPMAPRPGSLPMSRANPKPASPPVSPEKLAERLRSQRDASAKLAEQRVQVARQRADAPPAAPIAAPKPAATVAAAVNAGPKPKFTFAEEEANAARQSGSGQMQRPAGVPPVVQPGVVPPRPAAFQPQPNPQSALAPSRPSLGAPPQQFQPRPQVPVATQAATPSQSYQQQAAPGFQPPGYGQQPAGYRPIDPATGYPQQPYSPYGQPQQYQQPPRPPIVPNQRFNMAPANQPAGYVPPGSGPRLNVPQRPSAYTPESSAFSPAQQGMRTPPRVARPADDFDDMAADGGVFDDTAAPGMQRPPGRRPTSVDYQQAYRDAEAGFDDEAPSSRLPWVLVGILGAGAVVAALLTWLYVTQLQPMMAGTNREASTTTSQPEVPVVPAPTQPARAQPEATQQSNTAAVTSRKQIYDRIVGDKEILGGQMVPTEQVPAQQDGAAAVPQSGDGAAAPAQDGDAVPLPIPPPPGDNTQGSLPTKPEDPNKQSAEIITPAAGESQAAVAVPAPGDVAAVAQGTVSQNTPSQIAAAQPSTAPAVPAPGEVAAATPAVAAPSVEQPTEQASEQIAPDEPKSEAPKAIVPKKKVASAADKAKQQVKKQTAALGSKPVVLVPASKKAKALAQTTAADTSATALETTASSADDGLYGTKYIADSPAVSAPAAAPKKKTLASLFANDEAAPQAASNTAPEATPPKAAAPKAVAPAAAPKPAPVQTASAASGGYVAQLASFGSNAEANAEFARIKGRTGSVLNGLSPVIRQADVGGTTRYRLAVGPFASRDQANALCSKLFAAGERDCLVRN